MKKLLLALFLFSGLILSAKGQQYHPLLDSANYWHYSANYFPVKLQIATDCSYPMFFDRGEGQFTSGDTIINSLVYKIMDAGDPQFPCRFGYIREDTSARKVYFLDNNGSPEILLYDFSMQVNDSLYINFIASNGYFESGYYKLDSIKQVNIDAGQRQEFFLNCHNCASLRTLSWIEGVGSRLDVVYPYYSNVYTGGGIFNCSGQPYDSFQFLICFEQDSAKVYTDSCSLNDAMNNGCIQFIDSCHYGNICSGLDEHSVSPSLSIEPNPTTDHAILNMELPYRTEAEILLYDIFGRRQAFSMDLGWVAAGRTKQEIHLPALPDGIYFIECRTKNGSAFQKVVIQQ